MDNATQEQLRHLIQMGLLLRAKAHMWHLATRSYSQHMAFEELYTAVGEGVDKLAEASIGTGLEPIADTVADRWQTEFGGPEGYEADLLPFFEALVANEKQTRTAGYGWLANIVEELHGDLRQVYYKLKRFS